MDLPSSLDMNGQRPSSSEDLSPVETIKLHAFWALNGLIDASRWDTVARIVLSDPEIRGNVLKSAVLNSLSLITIYTFDLFILPILGQSSKEKWLHRNISSLYQILFQLPVVGMSLYLNTSWSGVVAKRVYALQHGRAAGTSPKPPSGIIPTILSSAYRWILIATNIFLTFALGYVPLLGPLISFMFMCWVDAYYCFEFIWISRGFSLEMRTREEEERWTYFLGFGFTSAALCMWGSSLANAALFALLFPGYVIMAIHAQPLPTYPYAPNPPVINYATGEERTAQPWPFIPTRIAFFAPVVALNNALIKFAIIVTQDAGFSETLRKGEKVAAGETELVGAEEGIPFRTNRTSYRVAPTTRQRGKKLD